MAYLPAYPAHACRSALEGPAREHGLHADVQGGCPVRLQMQGSLDSLRRVAEDIAIVRRTVMAAYDAVLPAGCQRTIYLCDDGKDPKKRKFCDGIGPDVRLGTSFDTKPHRAFVQFGTRT